MLQAQELAQHCVNSKRCWIIRFC